MISGLTEYTWTQRQPLDSQLSCCKVYLHLCTCQLWLPQVCHFLWCKLMGPKLGIRFDSTNLFFSFTQGSWVTMKKIVICQVTTRNFLNSSCSQTPSRYSHIFFLILACYSSFSSIHLIFLYNCSSIHLSPLSYLSFLCVYSA